MNSNDYRKLFLFSAIAWLLMCGGLLAQQPLPTKSINWAGYIAASNVSNAGNGAVKMVNGTWIVQNVTQTESPYGFSAQWVGIDGAVNEYLIQTGTASFSSNSTGTGSYSAWYETLPHAATTIPDFVVYPGDRMYASISLTNKTKNLWVIRLNDITQGENFSIDVAYTTPMASAEWIDERPYVWNFFPPLAQFNTSYFGSSGNASSDFASIGAKTANLSALQSVKMTMYEIQNISLPQVVPSNLSGTGNFSVIMYPNASVIAPSGEDVGYYTPVSATTYGGSKPFSYQWYVKSPSSTSFTPVRGATSPTYSFGNATLAGVGAWDLMINATDSLGHSATYVKQVDINNVPSIGTQPPSESAAAIDLGENITFTSPLTVVNGTAPYSYAWAEKAPGASGFSQIRGSGALSFNEGAEYPLNSVIWGSCTPASSSIYCVGGEDLVVNSSGYFRFTPQTQVEVGKVINNSIVSWSSNTQYGGEPQGPVCVSNSMLYCIGGVTYKTPKPINHTSYTALTGIKKLTWYGSNVTIPGAVAEGQLGDSTCPEANGYVYCISPKGQASYVELTANGTGQWQNTTSPDSVLSFEQADSNALFLTDCAASNTDIYCVGGVGYFGTELQPEILTNQTFYAPISSSGIGAWNLTTPYPVTIDYNTCSIYGNYIYCTSGVAGNGALNLSYYAPISTGGIGQWTQSQSYPDNTSSTQCSTMDGYMYCLEGCQNVLVVLQQTFEETGCALTFLSQTYEEKLLPNSYTFHSGNGATGTYGFELTARDLENGTPVATLPAYVTVNPSLSASVAVSNAAAVTGTAESINVHVNGGTPPYTYNILVKNSTGVATYDAVYNRSMQSNLTVSFATTFIGNYIVNAIVTDSAQTPVLARASAKFVVVRPITYSGPYAGNSLLQVGSSTSITVNEISGGVAPYYADWYYGSANVPTSNTIVILVSKATNAITLTLTAHSANEMILKYGSNTLEITPARGAAYGPWTFNAVIRDPDDEAVGTDSTVVTFNAPQPTKK